MDNHWLARLRTRRRTRGPDGLHFPGGAHNAKEDMETDDKPFLALALQAPGAAASRRCLALVCLALVFGGGMAAVPNAALFSGAFPAQRDPLLALAQGTAPPLLPSLVLPPDATAGPPMFVMLMRQGDSAMLHGNVAQARLFYERAAMVHQASSAAPLAVGKTFDPNILSSLGVGGSFADPVAARAWYGRARTLGDSAAADLLARLP